MPMSIQAMRDIQKLNTNRQKRSTLVVMLRFEAFCVFLAFLLSFFPPIKVSLYD